MGKRWPNRPAGHRIPQARGSILGGSRDEAAIRGERDHIEPPPVFERRRDWFAGLEIPDSTGIVPRRGCQFLSIRGQLHAINLTSMNHWFAHGLPSLSIKNLGALL